MTWVSPEPASATDRLRAGFFPRLLKSRSKATSGGEASQRLKFRPISPMATPSAMITRTPRPEMRLDGPRWSFLINSWLGEESLPAQELLESMGPLVALPANNDLILFRAALQFA